MCNFTMSGLEKKQYQIIVKGKVQKVGFRDKVEDLADELGLFGSVQNHSTKDIFILVEGDEQTLKEFIESIQTFAPPVKIRGMEVVEYPYEGEYTEFIIVRGTPSDELIESADSFFNYLQSRNESQDRVFNE